MFSGTLCLYECYDLYPRDVNNGEHDRLLVG